ncbi:MAG: SAM-dependent DNA methyltransferase [Armatimonadetes bacterium]|nr:SAM-dependent DNA methyltransferase [Armatimonadota bacterium]
MAQPMRQNSRVVTLDRLESHLWAAANILRGPVDASDFKTFIFPLLFFKRICDVFDEEYEAALEESSGDIQFALFAENHRFQIPEGAHWKDVRERTANLGQALQSAFRAIEQANPDTLFGIFGDAQWSNKERLSDALIRDLLEHFSKLSLGNENVTSDLLGDAYEYLIKKFADAQNKKAGEFYTPRSVVRMMVEVLDPQEGETAYDPACGTGGMLLGVIQHAQEKGLDIKRLYGKLFGQEKNLTTSAIARINLILHGNEDFRIARGDTLRDPAFFDGDRLAQFDCVIANPPFSLESWGAESWSSDPFGRNKTGVPPNGTADFAWVQHMLASMHPKSGRMTVVVPHGVLFRMGVEGRIREAILKTDQLEAVIGLAPNLFYGAGLAACVLVFRAKKSPERKGKTIIIDASHLFKKQKAQNVLLDQQAQQIVKWYEEFQDVEGVARVVDLSEFEAHGFNLNITRYVEKKVETVEITVEEAIKNLKDSLEAAYGAEDRLRELLVREGLLK